MLKNADCGKIKVNHIGADAVVRRYRKTLGGFAPVSLRQT